jgi:hypothetical protein
MRFKAFAELSISRAGCAESAPDMATHVNELILEFLAEIDEDLAMLRYTLHAVREGRPESLAAWRVIAVDPPAPGCPPNLLPG